MFAIRLAGIARYSVLLLPLLLLHAHGIAEIAIAVTGVAFLLHSAAIGDWAWLRTPWLIVAGAWWVWLVICSLPVPALDLGEGGAHSLIQAVATVRFLLLAMAMQHLVLRTEATRIWVYRLVAASAVWIGLNSVIQYAFGRNLLGWPPGGEGELTGPFGTPRAGPALSRIILPAVLPVVALWLGRPSKLASAAAYALLFGAVGTMVLIGQRMPLVLTVLGLVIVAILLRPLRRVILAAAVAGALLLAVSPVVAPKAYYRLVDKFSLQLRHFAVSPYGELYARAWQAGAANPITGLGFDGFDTGCPEPAYFRATFDGTEADGGGAKICWDHPHNYYLQALDDGGFTGLFLFSATAVAWLTALGRGLWRHPEPLRCGLFAAAALQLWPIQSSTAFTSMPIGGWLFFLLGWGLALSARGSR